MRARGDDRRVVRVGGKRRAVEIGAAVAHRDIAEDRLADMRAACAGTPNAAGESRIDFDRQLSLSSSDGARRRQIGGRHRVAVDVDARHIIRRRRRARRKSSRGDLDLPLRAGHDARGRSRLAAGSDDKARQEDPVTSAY